MFGDHDGDTTLTLQLSQHLVITSTKYIDWRTEGMRYSPQDTIETSTKNKKKQQLEVWLMWISGYLSCLLAHVCICFGRSTFGVHCSSVLCVLFSACSHFAVSGFFGSFIQHDHLVVLACLRFSRKRCRQIGSWVSSRNIVVVVRAVWVSPRSALARFFRRPSLSKPN